MQHHEIVETRLCRLAAFTCLGAIVAFSLSASSAALAQSQHENPEASDDVPIAGRPVNFSGAIGIYTIHTRAEPHELMAEEPLILTVQVRSIGTMRGVKRPELQKLPHFLRRFHIENLGERTLLEGRAKEYDFRLRPRETGVKQIPPLPFVYYRPGILPPERGFLTTYAPAIPLIVKPRPSTASEVTEAKPLEGDLPSAVFQLASGPVLLQSRSPFTLPGPLTLGVVYVVAPLAICTLWLVYWRHRYSDAIREARRLRSRACRDALSALEKVPVSPETDAVRRVSEVLAGYLRARFELAIAAPTPSEITMALKRAGRPQETIADATQFLGDLDAAQFGPTKDHRHINWTEAAAHIIFRLEDES